MDLLGIENVEGFESLKKGDIVVCEFKQPRLKNNKMTTFASYEVFDNHLNDKEIILQKKGNVYFNYMMYLNGEGNLKDIAIITKG
tara:strand:- start:1744 stop:1998 length:255 start_codon:yes stop_codon:yes gene_type:complete